MVTLTRFKKEQKVFDIAGVKLGGQPGELPTVLVGSIFYERHKIVQNKASGLFERAKAEELLVRLEELSNQTGSPFILDVVGETPKAFERYIDFVSAATQAPFLIDAPTPQIRLSAAKHVYEVGLLDRAIYNTISPTAGGEELKGLKNLHVKRAILLAHDACKVRPREKLELLIGYDGKRGLLDLAAEAGVEEPIIDTTVLDVPSIGWAARAAYLVKEEFGYPAGCAPANGISLWRRRLRDTMGTRAHDACAAGANLIAILSSCDFVFYGPIEASEYVFPACAMTDAVVAYAMREHGIRPLVKDHPLTKLKFI